MVVVVLVAGDGGNSGSGNSGSGNSGSGRGWWGCWQW